MQAAASLQVTAGQVIGGDFRIVKALNEGGMGAVYVVDQLSTGRRRALKVMHPQLVPDEKSRRRFTEEAAVGAKIPSEHVVEVIAAGVDGPTGIPWLAMELLDGSDLEHLIHERGALEPAVVSRLFTQLGHALAAAHAQGIVHRDLKPENLFVARSQRSDATSTLKILDFGIAKTVETAKTAATVTTAIGSPLWMAPEQGTPGASLRPSTDVWALGLLAFYFLTGRYYWASANTESISLQALLVEVMVHPIVAASQRAREVGWAGTLPPGFDAWFARCVVREPGGRFPEAGQAVRELCAVLGATAAATSSSKDGLTIPIHEHAARAVSLHGNVVAATAVLTSSGDAGRRKLQMLLGGVGVAAVGLSAVAIALVLGSESDAGEEVAQASSAGAPEIAGEVPQPTPGEVATREPTPDSAGASGAEPTEGEVAEVAEPAPLEREVDPPPTRRAGSEPTPRAATAAPRPRDESGSRATTSTETTSRSGGGDVDDLLNDALGSGGTGARPAGGASTGADTPSRNDVVSAMGSVAGAVSACGDGVHGLVPVRVVFSGIDGRVTSANVSGGNFSGPVRSCIAYAVRSARVPPFRQPSFSVNYPFRL
ncbi:MAG: protein kinase [Sandaracinaceae bacterium]|nr:protein kinase [Sandaracinaceae bacterium]